MVHTPTTIKEYKMDIQVIKDQIKKLENPPKTRYGNWRTSRAKLLQDREDREYSLNWLRSELDRKLK